MIFLVIMLPIEQAAAQVRSSAGEQLLERTRGIPEDIRQQGEAIGADIREDIQGIPGGPEEIIGEDIIVQVVDYQPKIIRSSLLEDSGIFVYALLSGTPTNPTITIPRIRNIVVRSQKVTTVPPNTPVSLGRITHVAPPNRELTYENLGTLVIPIRQIPQEGKVPDEIIVDVDARIFFDVSEGLFFGPVQDILTEQNFEEWRATKEEHSFYAGFVRATEIKDNKASFMVYDNQLNELTQTPITLSPGQTSRSLSANRGGLVTYGRLFDRYTLRLDSIRSLSDKVRLLINRNGNAQSFYLSEGQDLYPGSTWYVESIASDVKGTSLEVVLRNKIPGGPRQVERLAAKKLELPKIETPPPSPAQATQPSASQQQQELNKLITEYQKLAKEEEEAGKLKDYSKLIEETKTFLSNQDATEVMKEKAITLLKLIKNYYAEKRVQLEASKNINPEKKEEVEKLIQEINSQLKGVEEILKEQSKGATSEPSTPPATDDPTTSYRLAIAEYEKLIENYPTQRQYTAQAHWKIANLALLPGINDKQGAINHLEILLKNYQQPEYPFTQKTVIENLLVMIKSLESDLQSVVHTIKDINDEPVYVTLLGAANVPDPLKAKATIEVDGFPTKEYREGDKLLQDDSDKQKWYVKDIRDTEVILETSPNQILTISRNQRVSLDVGENKKRIVRLLKTSTKKEAAITISPNTEAAFSEAVFSLHLPIEKRALDLPLFSDSFEEEIADTEELLAKLDKIIENVGKITEYWKKFCFVTFGVIWVKNFFSGIFGGTNAIARERANEAFEKKYDDFRNRGIDDPKNCRGLSYEECLFKNQDVYDKMMADAEATLTDVQRGNVKQEEFQKLGSEYKETINNLGYYESLARRDPENQVYRDKVYEIHARLTRAQAEQEFSKQYFTKDGRIKPYTEIKSTADDLIKEYRDQFNEKDKNSNNNPSLWNTYSSRMLPVEREKQLSKKMQEYLNSQKISSLTRTAEDSTIINQLKETYGQKPTTELGTFKHNPTVAVLEQGRQKGYVEFLSVNPFHYLQVTYRSNGRTERVDLYKRTIPNGRMGAPSDVYVGVVDQQLLEQYKKIKDEKDPDYRLYNSISKGQECIGALNRKNAGGKFSRGEVIPVASVECSGLGAYMIDTAASSIGPSCTEFMSPSDCKILFNACDPVICPPSRCNLGGEWQVSNVVQTGIIGSTFLCLPNFGIEPLGIRKPGGVAMPVCLSGIYAGLQNLRSVIEGYRQCLITAKVQGRSVGICDRLRSFGICDILWKEGIALFNMKKGIMRHVVEFFSGKSSGGGEYSSFEKAVDNSVGGLQYFTQTYAKNTFAMYNGGSLPEIGTEICKTAIYGKAPGVGNFFDQIARPESPPQFTAFFDEAPYSDLGQQPLSQYKITYHIYAGDNEDVLYTIYMQAYEPTIGAFLVQPHVIRDSRGIIRNRRLARGTFASESPDLVLPSGMKEICVEINGRITGRKVECGFGKVSTGFAINYLSDQLTQSEAKKQINSAEECVPSSPPTIADLGLLEGGLGTVSSGFITTGIIRKCSKYNPGVGGDEDKWSPVGSCGQDERERDLGTCWIYVPAAKNLIKERSARLDINTSLAQRAEDVVKQAEEAEKPIPGFYILKPGEITNLLNEGKSLIKNNNFTEGRERYQQILGSQLVDEAIGAKVQFALAESHELEGNYKVRTTTTQQASQKKPAPLLEKITPNEISAGGTLTLEGKNFDQGFVMKINDDQYRTAKELRASFISQEKINIVIPGNAIPGTYQIIIINQDGKQSNTLPVTIKQSTTTTTQSPTTQPATCKIGSPYWGDKDGSSIKAAKNFQIITINMKSSHCENGEKVTLEIYEKDPFNNDLIATQDESITNNQIKSEWTARWEDDGFGDNPEYIIVAKYQGQKTTSSDALTVTK